MSFCFLCYLFICHMPHDDVQHQMSSATAFLRRREEYLWVVFICVVQKRFVCL